MLGDNQLGEPCDSCTLAPGLTCKDNCPHMNDNAAEPYYEDEIPEIADNDMTNNDPFKACSTNLDINCEECKHYDACAGDEDYILELAEDKIVDNVREDLWVM